MLQLVQSALLLWDSVSVFMTVVCCNVRIEHENVLCSIIVQSPMSAQRTEHESVLCSITVGPLIVQSPMSAQTTEHESVVFSCVMSGNPQPAVTWEREGADMQLPVATRRTISSTSVSNESLTLYTVS